MKIAFFGDVVGRPGREILSSRLPIIKQELGLDFVCVNGENSAGGFGITETIAKEIFDAGADCITPVSYTHLDVYKRQIFKCQR